MSWYDLISPLYDIGATGSGRPRREAVAQLRLEAGDVILDLACGTGLNFPFVEAVIGTGGLLVGLDYSSGMLAKARPEYSVKGGATSASFRPTPGPCPKTCSSSTQTSTASTTCCAPSGSL